jgi:hypothetical protein
VAHGFRIGRTREAQEPENMDFSAHESFPIVRLLVCAELAPYVVAGAIGTENWVENIALGGGQLYITERPGN